MVGGLGIATGVIVGVFTAEVNGVELVEQLLDADSVLTGSNFVGGLQFGVHSLGGHNGDWNDGGGDGHDVGDRNLRADGVWVSNIGELDPGTEGWDDGFDPRVFVGGEVRGGCWSN